LAVHDPQRGEVWEYSSVGDDAGLEVDIGDPVERICRRALSDDARLIAVGSRAADR
jgi:hypothetical protein